MRAVLICPGTRPGVAALARCAPLASIPMLGKSLVEYWLDHLTALGVKRVEIVASENAEPIRARVGDGARWGLQASVLEDDCELMLGEARDKYGRAGEGGLPEPRFIVLMENLPLLPQSPLFTRHADWFATARALIPHALTPDRIGVREVEPGVWIGMHTHIAPGVKLIGPCWIGEHSWIEAGAVIGPNVILEKEVFVARGAEIAGSYVGPNTFVGQFTEIKNSIAWGSTLINWERDSWVQVPDEFLLCSLEPPRVARAKRPVSRPARPAGAWRVRDYVNEALESLYAKISPRC
jgi:hypothetical protein